MLCAAQRIHERIRRRRAESPRLWSANAVPAPSCCLVIGGSFDAFDLVWAPCSALLLYSLFDSPFIAVINAMKELLPFTDVVPVATLAWLLAYAYPEATLTRVLAVRRIDEESERLDDWE